MMQTSLRGIANKAAQDKTHKFQNLIGLLTTGFLIWCWRFVNKKATAGVDRESALQYARDLESNAANLADRRFAGKNSEDWDDGHAVHAPVGRFRANPFGLHDMIGNVAEWCDPSDEQEGARPVIRGGSFSHLATHARASTVSTRPLIAHYQYLGVRAAMRIEESSP